MNTRTLVVAMLLASLPVLADAQTTTKKKKHKPAAAAVAPAPAAVPAPSTAPASAPAAEVSAPVAAKPAHAPAPAAPPLPAPTGPIGQVALVTGSVTVSSAMQARSLSGGDPISEGDTIVVGPNSYASLKFNDGGRVLLRPNTEFAVEQFRSRAPLPAATEAGPAAAPVATVQGAAFFRLVRGGLRAISGLIGHGEAQDYRVSTPAATIGIRGTDYEVQTCGEDCPSQAQALSGATQVAANELAGLQLAANNAGGGGGIIIATNEGAITLHTTQGDTVVDAGKVALSLAGGQVVMLPRVPDLLLLNSTPSPKACE